MEIIPVIDLKGGTVVHARMGQREHYRPIETPLARTSEPVDVVEGLMSVYPFASLYIADIDAIGGAGNNCAAIAQVKQAFPQTSLWVDSGIAEIEAAAEWLRQGLGHLVLGTETQTDIAVLRRISRDSRVVLSLDFHNADFRGPSPLLTEIHYWPQRVIVMTLHRVGSQSGPDLQRIGATKAVAGARAIYAAGGVRDAADLRSVAQAGATGALVASSLHSGRITAADLQALKATATAPANVVNAASAPQKLPGRAGASPSFSTRRRDVLPDRA